VNQNNQSKDITQMWKAINLDLDNFDEDLKAYHSQLELLKTIQIHSWIATKDKTTLADYVSFNDIETSKKNLSSRKQILETKMEKLNQNNGNLKRIIEGMNQNSQSTQLQKENILDLLKNYYNQIEAIGKKSGLFDSNYSQSSSHSNDTSDLEFDEEAAVQVTNAISRIEQTFEEAKELYEEYISICKRDFEKLTKINTAIGKNEGERIKTLKMFEMFKKEYKYFQTPKQLPKWYSESILEMKRRAKFKKFMTYTLDKLKALCQYENKKRDEFLEKNGLYMSKEMIPQLSHKAPLLKCVPKEFSSEEYPDGLLSENEKIAGVDCKTYYFHKVFSDIFKNESNQIIEREKKLLKELDEQKHSIRQIKDQHENEIIQLLAPYKSETRTLLERNNVANSTIETMQAQISKFDEDSANIKNASAVEESNSQQQKIDALKKRNKELAEEQDSKLRSYIHKNESLEQTIEGVNQRMKEALVRLNLNVDVGDDARFFESAFKELCKSHYRMSKDIEKMGWDNG